MAKILIVDDEAKIRHIISLMLRDLGHETMEADSGEAAIAHAKVFQPDLALLDLKLPGMDGLETLRRLREDHPTLDLLMMTAFGTINTAVEAMRMGAFDYVPKPFDNDDLIVRIQRALDLRRLSAEVEDLRGDLESRYGFTEIIGISPEMQSVFRTMAKVARVDATVLVNGESGTGKELVARAIHRKSQRSSHPFVAVNCSAIPETLVEAEFFGNEKGAFTDARSDRLGKFELANSGTLFLDEVGDLAIDAQAKLLRALQERKIMRLGASRPRPVDVRVIAATNKILEEEVKAGRFREDLFWRLNVVQIQLPALRQRQGDLSLLIDHFLERINRELGLSIRSISPEVRRMLCAYGWPGNVRELENTLCRSMILCEGDQLEISDLHDRLRAGSDDRSNVSPVSDLDELSLVDAVSEATVRLEKRMITARLAKHRGNRTATARSLGVSRKTLFNKMRQYELTDDDI